MKRLVSLSALSAVAASPAFAASGPFFSLKNTDWIVTMAFIVFVGILLYFKVPKKIGEMLDARAKSIENDLNEARALRDEAQALYASFERRQKEVEGQGEKIVEAARKEAELAAERAKADIAVSVKRRLAAAEDQIKSAEAAATKEVKDQAVVVAIAAARDVYAKQVSAADANKLIDSAIETVGQKLH